MTTIDGRRPVYGPKDWRRRALRHGAGRPISRANAKGFGARQREAIRGGQSTRRTSRNPERKTCCGGSAGKLLLPRCGRTAAFR